MWLAWDLRNGRRRSRSLGSSPPRRNWGGRGRLFEVGLLFVIYACWIRLADFRVIGTEGAAARGRWIWQAERWLHLPNEQTMQQWALHATWLVRFANTYYIVGHVAPLGVFLVWLYVRHRDAFGRWRNQLAFVSIVGGLIQFSHRAAAPLPRYGFVDRPLRPTGLNSAGFGQPGQLAAMPSMHVAWAILIAVAALTVSHSRWRWLGAAHARSGLRGPGLRTWLLDGIAARSWSSA